MKWYTLICLLALITSCKKAPEIVNPDIARLLEADSLWQLACSSNDPVKMAAFYDSMGFAVNGTLIIKGHANLENYWKGLMNQPGFLCTWHAEGADVSGDLGSTYGKWTTRMPGNGGIVESHGIYLATWKKQKNGEWKVLVDKP
ncbi:MAG TPA: nuclear transport factor 2 family protein [Bacteroidales bacterium]|nr:nuclear transport factor 2 family protein [Bacteroidales bacterium]